MEEGETPTRSVIDTVVPVDPDMTEADIDEILGRGNSPFANVSLLPAPTNDDLTEPDHRPELAYARFADRTDRVDTIYERVVASLGRLVTRLKQ